MNRHPISSQLRREARMKWTFVPQIRELTNRCTCMKKPIIKMVFFSVLLR